MFRSVRRFVGIAVGVLAFWGPQSQQVHAQMFPAAALGSTLQTQAMLNSPLSYGGGFAGMGMYPLGGLGYGSLMNGYGGIGGYGILGTAMMGAGLGYGYGWGMSRMGTQWMMNPYQGYLRGAANLTRANAEYYRTIQQAKLNRQESIRSSIETRRAMIEEADWERARMPDPEKLRQQALERELSRARVSPPPTDIWSARSLNALLRHLITQQGAGVPGPKVPLSEDIVKHINVSAGNTRGNVGLLKNNDGNLEWPESLMRGEFKDKRERLNALMKEAYNSLANDTNPSDATLNDLQRNFRDVQKILETNTAQFSPNLYIEANRYLGEVKNAITALKDPNVANHFNRNWEAKTRNVAELVQFMREKGLRFAPATDKDRPAYIALHHALAAFDANLPRLTSGSPDNPDNR